MKFCNLFSKLTNIQNGTLFDEIIGYDHTKRLFRMALDSESAVHILLEGPPASAKTMFLTSLMHRLKNSYLQMG
jgi:predicted ATPase with chaperone activity